MHLTILNDMNIFSYIDTEVEIQNVNNLFYLKIVSYINKME